MGRRPSWVKNLSLEPEISRNTSKGDWKYSLIHRRSVLHHMINWCESHLCRWFLGCPLESIRWLFWKIQLPIPHLGSLYLFLMQAGERQRVDRELFFWHKSGRARSIRVRGERSAYMIEFRCDLDNYICDLTWDSMNYWCNSIWCAFFSNTFCS